MSYDLEIKPENSQSQRRTLTDVLQAIESLAGFGFRRINKTKFVFSEDDGSEIELYIGLSNKTDQADALLEAISLSTSFGEETPRNMYRICAKLACALSWKVYDPQEGEWYEPEEVANAASDRTVWDFDAIATLITVLAVFLTLPAAFLWYLRGKPRDFSFLPVVIGLLLFFGSRLAILVRKRGYWRRCK